MIDATKEEMAMIRAMSDADLLAQLNGCDPYDDEFRRRFIALAEERDALADEAEGAAAIIAAERAEVLKLRGALNQVEENAGTTYWLSQLKRPHLLRMIGVIRGIARAALKGDSHD